MNHTVWFFYTLDYIICIILSTFFIKYFPNKKVSKFIKILSHLIIFANCLLFFTLPYEIIYYNLRQDQIDEEKKKKNNIKLLFSNFSIFKEIANETNKTELEEDIEELREVLRGNYGTIFWVLFTIANNLFFYISYLQSGEFTFCKKLLDCFKNGLIFMIGHWIIVSILGLIYQNLAGAFLFVYAVLPIAYIIGFLAISIVKIPRRMYIHSDNKLALEYYEFRANKKLKELNKNEEDLKKIYSKCQNTFDYIKKIEEYKENIKNNKKKKKENNIFNENILENEKNNDDDDDNIEEEEDEDNKNKNEEGKEDEEEKKGNKEEENKEEDKEKNNKEEKNK